MASSITGNAVSSKANRSIIMKTSIPILLLILGLSLSFQCRAQDRPDPGDAPTFIPAPPPISAEIEPFPSDAAGELAFVAFIYDPEKNRIIISLDSLSNSDFVLQTSTDLKAWQDANQTITGNKSIITFYIPLSQSGGNQYFRVQKM